MGSDMRISWLCSPSADLVPITDDFVSPAASGEPRSRECLGSLVALWLMSHKASGGSGFICGAGSRPGPLMGDPDTPGYPQTNRITNSGPRTEPLGFFRVCRWFLCAARADSHCTRKRGALNPELCLSHPFHCRSIAKTLGNKGWLDDSFTLGTGLNF